MKTIVPLAGPDFEKPDGSVKAELLVEGEPLLRRALESRPWRGALRNEDLVFVMRDTPASRRFREEKLVLWYPGCLVVEMSAYARGAAFSTLAGLALVGQQDEVVCADLVDILYDCDLDPVAAFAADPAVGGIALTFPSDNPIYSYLQSDDQGRVVRAAEKKVISGDASAGTYFFRNPAALLQAVAHSLNNRDAVMHNGLFYVCPLMNGIIDAGLKVQLSETSNIRDVKI